MEMSEKEFGKSTLSGDFIKMLSSLLGRMCVSRAACGCPTGLCLIPRDPTYRDPPGGCCPQQDCAMALTSQWTDGKNGCTCFRK